MALQDAGVSMKCMPVAVTVALHREVEGDNDMEADKQEKIVVNPNAKIEQESLAVMTFVFDSSNDKLLSTYSHGPLTPTQYAEGLKSAKEASNAILQFFRDSITKKLSADIR